MKFDHLFRKKTIDDILAHAAESERAGVTMKKSLRVRDLTAMGIAAIIGAGIFSTIGTASVEGGPAVSMLFIFTAVACGFSALCYAQFASMIPISGSAYTYAYASFGELMAWIIGWTLIMEYSVGNIAVAISWSEYLTTWIQGMGLHFPEYLGIDYLSAFRGYHEVTGLLAAGTDLASVERPLSDAYHAYASAPVIFGIRLIADIPAFLIVVLITVLVYIGIYETKVAGNTMVLLKLIILMVVIGVGAFYVKPENWSPFAPNGIPGVLKGVSGVFFAYIGFDAISTTAEECRNPSRDLPLSMLLALLITTVIYVSVSFVLTGMVNYRELGVADPLAYVFEKLHLDWLAGIISFSAVIAMAGVILVFQLGQPRIWMSMSRDGLLPPRFAKLHPRFKTPAFSTIITGLIVAVPALFTNLVEMTDLTSIGTLFAFILVCGGVIVLDARGDKNSKRKGFRIYYLNSRYWLLPLWAVLFFILFKTGVVPDHPVEVPGENGFLPIIPGAIFAVCFVLFTVLAVWKQWSLIPVLGLVTNIYLISKIGVSNWIGFTVWLLIGLALYFAYGARNSRLKKILEKQNATSVKQ